jgi:hypothetical protein
MTTRKFESMGRPTGPTMSSALLRGRPVRLGWLAAIGASSALGCLDARFDGTQVEYSTEALTGANLGGANLAGMNLGGANLGGANLAGMNMGGTNLGGANLGGANLGGANMGGNNLGGANLGGANLAGMNLGGANLGGANLAGTDLGASSLGGSTAMGTKLLGSTIAGTSLGPTNLLGADSGRNIHMRSSPPSGMLYSGEDQLTPKTDQCIVMGIGSTAFSKLLAQQTANTKISVALGQHRWGFSTRKGGPIALTAWEAVVWGDKTYCTFVLGAPPGTTWAGVAGFMKAVFRWQAPPTQSIEISGIEASASVDPTLSTAIDSYTGMMNTGGHFRAGRVGATSFIAGEMAFVTATTNNQTVQVDFSSWVMDSTKLGLVLGNVQSTPRPAYAESVYIAVDKGDGVVAIKIANADALKEPSAYVASSNQDLMGAYNVYLDGGTSRPIARRCGGALYLAYYFARYGETVPAGKCDAGLTWIDQSFARDYRSWTAVAGTTGPMNQYMALPLDATHPFQRSDDGSSWQTVLSETYVHMWEKNYDTTGPLVIDDQRSGNQIDSFYYPDGIWQTCSTCAGAHRNSKHFSKVKDGIVSLWFIGTNLKLYGVKDAQSGIGAVSIDGGADILVDFYKPTTTGNELLWSSPTLPAGKHTFKLRVTGTKSSKSTDTTVSVDRVDVW